MTNRGDTQSSQRIGLFLFIVLRVWLHGYLASLLLNLVRQHVMMGAHSRCIAAHYMRCQYREEEEGAKALLVLREHTLINQVPTLEDSLTPRRPWVWD